jgi:hypothetical protein
MHIYARVGKRISEYGTSSVADRVPSHIKHLQPKRRIALERCRNRLHAPCRNEIVAQIENGDVVVQWGRRQFRCNSESSFVAKLKLAQFDLSATRGYAPNCGTDFRIAASKQCE